jgi:phosphatidylserine decarboxylase
LFCNESYLASDDNNKPRWLNLSATKDLYDKHVAGEILVKFSLASSNANDDIAKLWKGLLSAMESNSLGSSGSGYYFDTNDRASVYSAGDDSMEEDKPSLKTDEGLETLPSEVDVSKLQLSDQEKKKAEALKKKQLGGYELSASSNVIGMIFLEIVSVSDLPKYKNVTRTGFDMDPFVVI